MTGAVHCVLVKNMTVLLLKGVKEQWVCQLIAFEQACLLRSLLGANVSNSLSAQAGDQQFD